MADKIGNKQELPDSLKSPNGSTQPVLENGNLVLYYKDEKVWETNTKGNNVKALLQSGNLILYDENDNIWASNSCCHPNAELQVLDNGDLVIHEKGNIFWETNTVTPSFFKPSFPIRLSNTVHNGRVNGTVDENGKLTIYMKGTHSGYFGQSKFTSTLFLGNVSQEIIYQSPYHTLTVGSDDVKGTNTKDDDWVHQVPGDILEEISFGYFYLHRHQRDISSGTLDEMLIQVLRRGGRIWKELKDSELWEAILIIYEGPSPWPWPFPSRLRD
jgi:hypothetical protein